jgi:hypothetical protein
VAENYVAYLSPGARYYMRRLVAAERKALGLPIRKPISRNQQKRAEREFRTLIDTQERA